MNASLYFAKLCIADVCATALVLAQKAVVDAYHLGEGTYIDHTVVFKERAHVKVELWFFGQFNGYRLSILFIGLNDFLDGIHEVALGFGNSVTGADELHHVTRRVVGDIGAVALFLNLNFHNSIV